MLDQSLSCTGYIFSVGGDFERPPGSSGSSYSRDLLSFGGGGGGGFRPNFKISIPCRNDQL